MSADITLQTKLKVSANGLNKTLRRPLPLLGILLLWLALLGIILWLPNLNLLRFAWSNPMLDPLERIGFFFSGYEGIATNFTALPALSLLAVSLLSAINVVLITIIGRTAIKHSKSSGAGIGAGLLGLGCAACGTTIVAPLLATLTSGLAIGLIETVGIIANVLAVVLLGYSMYRLGQVGATLNATTFQSESV